VIEPKAFQNCVLKRNGKMGEDVCEIMAAAIQAVEPYQCIRDFLSASSEKMWVGQESVGIRKYQRVFLIGFGKAAVPMAKAIIDILGARLTQASVITKDRSFLSEDGYQGVLRVHLGGHPVPNEDSINSTRSVLQSLPKLTHRDLVLVVVSGGGSALFTDPMNGISLDDLQQMTEVLLRCGADIYEINTLRKHLDRVKGGQLVLQLQPADIHTFILSDVIGDSLGMIASGPTVPDSTSYGEALAILRKYHIRREIPRSILKHFEEGASGKIPETLKIGDIPSSKLNNHLVGSNSKALQAAKEKAEMLGYEAKVMSNKLTGLTETIAGYLERIIQKELTVINSGRQPICLLFGGETTVKVTGTGKGGRNQDLVLRLVPRLAEIEGVLFISLATDGEDGPTDAAGAASDALVYREGTVEKGLDVITDINTNNAYRYLDETGALIRTGSTGTNVNDLVLILIRA